MAVAIETFLPQVTIHLSGCPDDLVIRQLRAAAQQFCRDVAAWTASLGFATLDADDLAGSQFDPVALRVIQRGTPASGDEAASADYDPARFPDTEREGLGRILAIALVEGRGAGESTRWVAFTTPPGPSDGSAAAAVTKPPYRYANSVLYLEREAPHYADGFTSSLEAGVHVRAAVILEPAPTDTMFSEDVAVAGELAIVDRAIFELKSMAGEEWSDSAGADRYEKRYLKRLGNEKVRIARKRTKLSIRVHRPPFV